MVPRGLNGWPHEHATYVARQGCGRSMRRRRVVTKRGAGNRREGLVLLVSDNIQSGASMVIYGGMGESSYTMNGAGAGIASLNHV